MEEYFYIDTSVYLGVLLGEDKALVLAKQLQQEKYCSSVLLFIEAERNLIRMTRDKELAQEACQMALGRLYQDMDSFVLKNIDRDLVLNRSYPPVKTPKSLDLIHLRTALWFLQKKQLKKFVTLDEHQASAAVEMNIPLF